jgi:translation initiation factor IF-3
MCGMLFIKRRCSTIAAKNNSKEMTINEAIFTLPGFSKQKQVRVIGADGEQVGVITAAAALESAYDKGYDLVLMAPQGDPPVCRIMDYGKFRFERDKKEKEAKKKQQIVETKEIQLSCRIDVNDFNTKVNHAHRFLTGGDKVKVMVRFRGRQLSHVELGAELLKKFEEACAEKGTVDKAPAMEGRSMIMFLNPIKPGKEKSKQKSEE